MKKSIFKSSLTRGLIVSFSFSMIFSVGSPSALAGVSDSPQVTTYKNGELQSYLGANFLYATSSFDSSGGQKSLYSSGDYYYVLQAPIGARYSITDNWAMSAALQIGAAESKTSDPLYVATRTNSTVNQIMIGTDFLMMEAPIELIPEFEFIYNLENIDKNSDVVMTSEGVMQVTADMKAQQKFGRFIFLGKLGYTYRGGGRSHLIPFSLAGAVDFEKSILGLELSGFQSVTNDQDKGNTVLRDGSVLRTEAGVKRFYSINPSALDATVFFNYDWSEAIQINLNAGYILAGSNFAQGFHVGTMLTFNWDLNHKQAVRIYPVSAPLNQDSQLSSDKDVDMFKEEVHDGVDQKIFKPEPTPKPSARPQVAPVTGPRVRPTNISGSSVKSKSSLSKRKIKIQPDGPTDEQLQQHLDNTEMKIQLKKNR